jgi:hypothetical protein
VRARRTAQGRGLRTAPARRGLVAVLAGAVALSGCSVSLGGPDGDRRAAATPAATGGRALAVLDTLPVKGRAPKTGYEREQFGPSWTDTDRNGCDTRNDVLRRDLVREEVEEGTQGCVVLSGDAAPDPYTGEDVHFVRGGASEVDVDHVVALSDAWQKGATPWPFRTRLAFANDPLNLLAVDAAANRQKGDGDAATWLPAHKPFRCAYVARQVAVKAKYGLWVTAAERDAVRRVLADCPDERVPAGGAPTRAPVKGVATPPGEAPPGTPGSGEVSPEGSVGRVEKDVRPGAFCADAGARGVTDGGTRMHCTSSSSDDRLRWRGADRRGVGSSG